MSYANGQELWWVANHCRNTEGQVVRVVKVGRKWATLSNHHRVDIDTGMADGGQYTSPGRVYRSEREYKDEVALQEAWAIFRRAVDRTWAAPSGLTVDDISAAMSALRITPKL